MELIIQKAVELGVYEIVPVATKRAVVKLDPKKEEKKRLRWQSIAESAAKQSRRNIIPHIHEVVKFGQAVDYAKNLDITLIPYELAEDMEKTKQIFETIQPGQSIGIFIGPEADLMKVRLYWHRKMASARLHWENGSCGRKLPVWRCFRF